MEFSRDYSILDCYNFKYSDIISMILLTFVYTILLIYLIGKAGNLTRFYIHSWFHQLLEIAAELKYENASDVEMLVAMVVVVS